MRSAALWTLCLALPASAWTQAAPAETAAGRSGRAAVPTRDTLHPVWRWVPLPLSGARLAFLEPGDRVDVLATFDRPPGDSREGKATATLLKDVWVTAVLRPARLEELGVVELMLNINEAQYAVLARHQGELDLAVRAEGDREDSPMRLASFERLLEKGDGILPLPLPFL